AVRVGDFRPDALAEELPHESVGAVHGREGVDRAADLASPWAGQGHGARDELGGVPDFGVEELDRVAAEFLAAAAADGGFGLREQFDARAVDELDAAGGDLAVDEVGEVGPVE